MYYDFSIEKTLDILKTTKNGLTSKEADIRQKEFGKNELDEIKKTTAFEIFIRQVKNPLIVVLIIAAVISVLLHEYIDVIVILFAILVNAIIGFVQEIKAEKTMESLKKMVKFEAIVLRDGKKVKLDIKELVPGDIVFLENGDRVPADGRIIEFTEFSTDESILTGESIHIQKNNHKLTKNIELSGRKNMVYMATNSVSGRAIVVITNTGNKTEVGKINDLIKFKEDKTPIEKKQAKLAMQITKIIIGACFIMFAIGIIFGRDIFEMFITSVAIAVSAMPEGLVIGVTVILAIGMIAILKKNALVRNLNAAQTLGSVGVICTDKTGTITQGKMYVTEIYTEDQEVKVLNVDKKLDVKITDSVELTAKIFSKCNNAYFSKHIKDIKNINEILGSPTEKALLYFSLKNNIKSISINDRLDEIPFSSDKKVMFTMNKNNSKRNIIYTKGAPEKILEISNFIYRDGKITKLDKKTKEKVENKFKEIAALGLRILGCAFQECPHKEINLKNIDINKNFIFTGFVGISDPVRTDAKKVIKKCREAGIRLCMITGDNKIIAKTIGDQTGLINKKNQIIEGWQIDELTDNELEKTIKKVNIFARTTPSHKLRIINAFKNNGEIVSMTGDGVNDAPALKLADIGVALGSGTDIAKESSDIILLDDSLKNIVASVEQGRVVYRNIQKMTFFLLSDSFSRMFLIIGGIFLGFPIPILASQILVSNLIEDTFPAMALSKEPADDDIMKESPVGQDENILNFEMKFLIGFISIFLAFFMLLVFYFLYYFKGIDLKEARTVVFAISSVDSMLYVFSAKNLHKRITLNSITNNKYLLYAVLISFFSLIFIIYNPLMNRIFTTVPLNFIDWVLIFLVSLTTIFLIEIIKHLFNKKYLKNK
ncbi:HAD-IC family P-type ATPase [Patescibacteria group bacterium]|nr:HAD-IC family P-type ATPase [Patescibacteria group bacterium]